MSNASASELARAGADYTSGMRDAHDQTHMTRTVGRLAGFALAHAAFLAACSTIPLTPASGPPVTTIDVVERGWHTDVCVQVQDVPDLQAWLAQDFVGATHLCFGFGEREFAMTREHSILATLSALWPGRGAILMTVLRDTPVAAYGADKVVTLQVAAAGKAGLAAYLDQSVQRDKLSHPVRLGDGPYAGSLYFGATANYAAYYTCNTWTADALRSAQLPVDGTILFASTVFRQARDVAACQHPGNITGTDPACIPR
ncbi:DUF2459 domain-containing protein [Paraburkholderia hospita]|uniref:DUF2459 domain-containing protein n=1 Tax=Paraburkholderia hospita TaxID=169430 RepID=UPI001FCA0E9B|nr:DUF2459 domain-containing protein [Paraburkholderia hospita]